MLPVLIKNVEKRYDDHTALAGLNLALEKDDVTVLIGRSGCGKSTLLRLCNGMVVPDAGQVCVLGQQLDYRDLTTLRRKIGYAMQGVGLFPHLSARDNITLLARLEQWSRETIEERLTTLLELVQLESSCLDRLPHQLSGGQQQRAGLCRALFLRPRLLLLDEAFSASDPLTRDDIHRQWQAMQRAEAVTTLLVTHDMHEALRLGDRIIVMDDGKIVQDHRRDTLEGRYPGLAPNELLRRLMGDTGR